MPTLPKFLKVKKTKTHTHVALNMTSVKISFREDDSQNEYFFASAAAAKKYIERQARSREEEIRKRPDASEVELTTRGLSTETVEWKLVWWRKNPPKSELEDPTYTCMKDYFCASPHRQDYCVI